MKKPKPVDPIVLATTTAALATLAVEAGRSDASEATKARWADCSNLFSWWKGQPPPQDIVIQMAQRLLRDPARVRGILEKLRQQPDSIACKFAARVESPILIITEAKVEGTP